HQKVAALPEGHLELRCADRTLLRDDLNDPSRGFGTVQGGRSGTLDDLDALDVARIEVVQAGGCAILNAWTQIGPVVDANAIDVDQRLLTEGDGRKPAYTDCPAAPHVPVGAGEAHSGLARRK